MPDILGRNAHFYDHYVEAEKHGHLKSMLGELKRRGRVHNFDALRGPRLAPLNDVEAAAQAISYITNNLQAVQSEIERVLYLDFRPPEWFPIKYDIPEGAKTYSYRVVDRRGIGSFIENGGTNAQGAGVTVQNVPYNIEYGGMNPYWTLQDLRVAAFGGIALDTETIGGATEGCMDHIEQVWLTGDADRGFEGIINMSEPVEATSTKTFALSTGDELVAEIQKQVTAVIAGTNEIFGRILKSRMAIYLPVSQADVLANRGYGDNRDKTAWEYVRTNNLWTQYTGKKLDMIIVAELKGAGAGATDRALFGFPDEPKVWEAAMPISPRVITTHNEGHRIYAPMEYTISGLNSKRAGAMRYLDGI